MLNHHSLMYTIMAYSYILSIGCLLFIIQSALGWEPLPSPEEADKSVGTRLRKLDAPLTEYLLSRSVAGTTHGDIITGIQKLTGGKVVGSFHHMHPSPPADLLSWLREWIEIGVVPLATLNLQKGVPEGRPIPDAWHHQMIHGVSDAKVYLTNPREELPLSVIQQQINSESVLLVRREDVVSRWTPSVNWELIRSGRWAELNVVENIIQMMLDHVPPVTEERLQYTHIAIPAAYMSGITLFAIDGTPGAQRLKGMTPSKYL